MMQIKIVKNGRTLFSKIEVAKSYAEKAKGLSGRHEIGSDGLLMVFPNEARHGIWMPNMKFPIDILFIDSRKTVTEIRHDTKPLSINPKTWKIYRPKQKAKYVLEIPANSAKTKKLKNRDKLQFDILSSK